jgi:murein DD-endopeptidase MepM/ murein hydrolase activator NlpD
MANETEQRKSFIEKLRKLIHLFTLKELIAIGLLAIIVIFFVLFTLFFSLSNSVWNLKKNINYRDDKILKSLARLERSDSLLKYNDSIQIVRLNHIPTNPLTIENMSKVSSTYNYRKNPNTGVMEFHAGIDYMVKKGTPVLAAASGIVIKAGWDGGYGNSVEIDTGIGYKIKESHLSVIHVIEGQEVEQGQIIALSGNTGESRGEHLDHRITFDDKSINPVNFTYVK